MQPVNDNDFYLCWGINYVIYTLLATSFNQLNEYDCAQLILKLAQHKLQQAAESSLGNKPRLA